MGGYLRKKQKKTSVAGENKLSASVPRRVPTCCNSKQFPSLLSGKSCWLYYKAIRLAEAGRQTPEHRRGFWVMTVRLEESEAGG